MLTVWRQHLIWASTFQRCAACKWSHEPPFSLLVHVRRLLTRVSRPQLNMLSRIWSQPYGLSFFLLFMILFTESSTVHSDHPGHRHGGKPDLRPVQHGHRHDQDHRRERQPARVHHRHGRPGPPAVLQPMGEQLCYLLPFLFFLSSEVQECTRQINRPEPIRPLLALWMNCTCRPFIP